MAGTAQSYRIAIQNSRRTFRTAGNLLVFVQALVVEEEALADYPLIRGARLVVKCRDSVTAL